MTEELHLPTPEILDGRFDFLVSRASGHNVLHVGCVDSGLLEERLAQGSLLHARLAAVATRLSGVDADGDGIRLLGELGFTELVEADVCSSTWTEAFEDQHPDVVIASEVIEHLLEPGAFLKEVQSLLEPERTQLIITVPNAFRLETLRQMLHGVEFVHPDHKYWFSYRTLCHLIRSAGLRVDEVYVYTFESWRFRRQRAAATDSALPTYSPAPRPVTLLTTVVHRLRGLPRRVFVNRLYRRSPFWADGIIVVARLPRTQG